MKVTTAHPEIKITQTAASRLPEIDFDNIPFGQIFSDHMFIMDYRDGRWMEPRIEPFAHIPLHPATSAIHYGQSIFEGMKAYRGQDGRGLMFRPDMNIARFNKSAHRMAMPEVPEEIFHDALHKLLSMDQGWIPGTPGSSLYIRPFLFATEEFIGIKVAENYRFMIITCPVGVYYPKPVNVLVAEKFVRAFPGGVGYAKAAGNYGAVMHPLRLARERGYDQMLWLDGKEFKYAQEIGTMNVFFVTRDKVLTPSTEEGTILDGVTRDSVIHLLREKGYTVEERPVEMSEIVEHYKAGDLLEVFGTGTAATVAQIIRLGYLGTDYDFDQANWGVSNLVKKSLEEIRYGQVEDKYGWCDYIS